MNLILRILLEMFQNESYENFEKLIDLIRDG
jgi:hypothetical protein